jgi:histidine transport system permease protein
VIDIIQTYWRAFLYSDGYTMTGVAMTLWLLVASLAIGFCIALPLAIARNSRNPAIWGPVWVYVFIFTGTPLYVQLLIIYTGVYSLSIVQHTPFLNEFFRKGIDCTILAFGLNTGAYTTAIFAGAIRDTNFGEVEAARHVGGHALSAHHHPRGAAPGAAGLQQRGHPHAAFHHARLHGDGAGHPQDSE